MTQARTEHGTYRFAVKEDADGSPWLVAEPSGGDMPVLENAFIGFRLYPRTSLDQAYEIARFMNQNLAGMSITLFDSHPQFANGKEANPARR